MNNKKAVLSATLVAGGEGLTPYAISGGAYSALRLSRTLPWVGGETRQFEVEVICRGAKHQLSYMVTFGSPE